MRTIVLLAFAAAALLPAPRADACSFVPPPRLADAVTLLRDQTDVPTNFVLLAAPFDPSSLEENSLWLRKEGEDTLSALEVSFDDDFTRIRAREPLEPSSSYALLSFPHPGLPTVGDNEAIDDSALHVIPFETGSGPDEEPPPPPSVLRVETQEVMPRLPFLDSMGSDCGAPTEGGTWARFFVEPDDDAALYVLTRGDPAVRVETRRHLGGEEEVFLSEIARGVGGVQPYRITAFDRAGNESEAHEEEVHLGCPGTCASGDPAPLGLVLGLLALRLRRRRRASVGSVSPSRA